MPTELSRLGASPRAILVTGAGGFIGSRLVARLAREEVNLRLWYHRDPGAQRPPRAEIIAGDLRDSSVALEATRGIDTIVHLAALVHQPDSTIDDHRAVNAGGIRNLLEAAEAASTLERFVFTSSVAVYGPWRGRPFVEQDEARPVMPYGVTKLEAEGILFEVASRLGWHATVIRPPLVYGAGCRGNLPRIARLVERRLFPPIPATSARHSLVHVDDLVDALVLAAAHPAARSRVFNVGEPRSLCSRDIWAELVRAAGDEPVPWSVDASLLRAAGLAGDLYARLTGRRLGIDSATVSKLLFESAELDATRIGTELGFRTTRTFAESARELLSGGRAKRGD